VRQPGRCGSVACRLSGRANRKSTAIPVALA
jgi:hypothetical protein